MVQRVADALAYLPFGTEAYYAHEPPPRRVAMQRLADLSALAPLSETTHLNVHPEYGPWIALRALVVFDGPSAYVFSLGFRKSSYNRKLSNTIEGQRILSRILA